MEQTNIQQTTGLQVFYNEETSVNLRTKVIGNEPWFIAQDICSILGLNNITNFRCWMFICGTFIC